MNYLSSLTKKDLQHTRVLVRVDCNVPMQDGMVLDDTRLRAIVPTISFLQKKGAKIIIIGHVGRPNGSVSARYSLHPIAKSLSKLCNKRVRLLDTKNWKWTKATHEAMVATTKRMHTGSIALCDNIRFSPEEEACGNTLIKTLASLGDIFVLDGFGVSHRADASVVGLPTQMPSYAGLLLEKEMTALSFAEQTSGRPKVLIMGGAKPETKLPVIASLYTKVDTILLGGVLVNTYLSAKGYEIGKSLTDKKMESVAKKWGRKRKVQLPQDVVIGSLSGKTYRVASIGRSKNLCAKNEYILDIGPKTIQHYAQYIQNAKTIIWNGGMGKFEQSPYHIGTIAIARLIGTRARGSAYGLVGGGETLQAVKQANVGPYIDHLSTGGGAMLCYLAEGTTPGIEALAQSSAKTRQ